MKDSDNLILQGLKIELATLVSEVQKMADRVISASNTSHNHLPEWINLETAVRLKGGAAPATYRTQLILQPCCGLNYKLIGGRKCWRREDIMRWLAITDADMVNYAAEWKVTVPEKYKKRKGA